MASVAFTRRRHHLHTTFYPKFTSDNAVFLGLYLIFFMLSCFKIRDRTSSVTGPGPGRSRTGSDRRRSNFWTGAGPLLAFLRCACMH